ncbi:DNA alkylation repair protein [Bradyrhizobium sp. SZCCHNR3015]|uniref:DNA alkylation repair protein n=1 Tax=Bradyrhizobium sp. SZCCHNR3015 TaxID=3057395 RepID=UPI0029161FD2|nr:DNA alkylation repair protein [Bradyrhizobium sp. SZCCHNR3015]
MDIKSARDYLEQLTVLLRGYGEPRRAAAAQNDKGSRYTFFAIRVPVLRRVATREFDLADLSADERLFVHDYIWNHSNDYEVMSIPLLYYRKKALRINDEWFATIRSWIDRVDDWGHCDDLATIYSYFNHNRPDVVFPFLAKLNRSQDIWRIRTSIVALVHYSGKGSVYLSPAEVLPFLDPHLDNKDKYIANAIGWVLRELSRKYPSEIASYIAKNNDRLTGIARRRAGGY